MRWLTLPIALSLLACSGGTPSRVEPEARASAATPSYALHEWGLISVRQGSFEVAAGPGQRLVPELTADKPVLYVHSEERFELSVRVEPQRGLEVVEHYPPTETSPLRWRATVGPHCAGTFPDVDDSRCPDGYCETGELPLYETADAACLEVGAVRTPLLFYRLRATGMPPPLPLEVRRDGDAIVVSNTGLRAPIGALWRVTAEGSTVRVTRAEVPPVGQSTRVARGEAPVDGARAALREQLVSQGLTPPERDAFLRAWDTALFGAASSDGELADEETDHPVRGPRDGIVDILTADRTTLDGPRLPDVLLYWLDPAGVAALAPLTAEPAPRALHRAFLVRVAP